MALSQLPLTRGLEGHVFESEDACLIVTGKPNALARIRNGEQYDVVVADHWGLGGVSHREVLRVTKTHLPSACTMLIVADQGTSHARFDFVHWHNSREQKPRDLIADIRLYFEQHTNASS
jgi:hypothetical protein